MADAVYVLQPLQSSNKLFSYFPLYLVSRQSAMTRSEEIGNIEAKIKRQQSDYAGEKNLTKKKSINTLRSMERNITCMKKEQNTIIWKYREQIDLLRIKMIVKKKISVEGLGY